MKTLLIVCLSLAAFFTDFATAAAFPTEAELKTSLRYGMTRAQVVARFGEPTTHNRVTRDSYFLRYFPSIHQLTDEREGYAGFEVQLVDDKVRAWRPIRGRPSYAPHSMSRGSRWPTTFWLVFFGCSFVYASVKLFNRQMSQEQAVQKAYRAREVPGRLPHEFGFITRETTLAEVTAKLGACSAQRYHSVNSRAAAGGETIASPTGEPSIVSYDYDLPYAAAVVLLPEYPFKLENRIRAVVYRPPRLDDER